MTCKAHRCFKKTINRNPFIKIKTFIMCLLSVLTERNIKCKAHRFMKKKQHTKEAHFNSNSDSITYKFYHGDEVGILANCIFIWFLRIIDPQSIMSFRLSHLPTFIRLLYISYKLLPNIFESLIRCFERR